MKFLRGKHRPLFGLIAVFVGKMKSKNRRKKEKERRIFLQFTSSVLRHKQQAYLAI